MITRIKALQSTIGLILTIIELTIAFQFLAKIFCSNDGTNWLWDGIGNNCGQFGHNLSSLVISNGIANQVSFLILILSFIIFTFLLVSLFPQAVEKKEKKMNWDWE
jgi:hypothetical protein